MIRSKLCRCWHLSSLIMALATPSSGTSRDRNRLHSSSYYPYPVLQATWIHPCKHDLGSTYHPDSAPSLRSVFPTAIATHERASTGGGRPGAPSIPTKPGNLASKRGISASTCTSATRQLRTRRHMTSTTPSDMDSLITGTTWSDIGNNASSSICVLSQKITISCWCVYCPVRAIRHHYYV